ncbi:hypothetical protein GH714_002121 [Hevea brasiliensis]|uniref:Terpene synthase metal-binding domain-containing protein n=1 Tax=Hevea brasiliensis TaxID=3981 RepID=A0A6A6KFF1_HEVBR|nr:hypothetical protein GH714_002121 [Hevea brasiliensis]
MCVDVLAPNVEKMKITRDQAEVITAKPGEIAQAHGLDGHYHKQLQDYAIWLYGSRSVPRASGRRGSMDEDCNLAIWVKMVIAANNCKTRQYGSRSVPRASGRQGNVFKKFKDSDGKFSKAISNDVKGILSLYEASFVSMRGEDILDEAIAFARPLLESLAMQSSPHLAKHINDALSMPFHKQELGVVSRGNSDKLPADYLKILYKAALDFFEELGDDEGNEGRSYCINYTKDRYKEVVRSYLVEAQWFNDRHLPPFNEYMHNALISSCFSLLPPVVFLGVEKLAGVKEFKWLETPKLVEASKFFGRLLNDMVARKDEEKEGHCLAGNCYMKEYGVSKEKAMAELRKMCDNAWKDMNEESMRPTAVPMPLITSIVNLARMMEVVFQYDDGYTIASSLKDHVTLMFVEPVPED